MKFKKIGLYITIFIISLFIINTNIKAYDINFTDDITINEDYIYEKFIEVFPDFNIEEYPNILCDISMSGSLGKIITCYAFNNYAIENFVYVANKPLNGYTQLQLSRTFDRRLGKYYLLGYYPESNKNQYSLYNSSFSINSITIYKNQQFTNFELIGIDDLINSVVNVLDFSAYLGVEEPEEPKINIKATNLLNFMIDKTKNIYEVLISNDIFKFILSIPLIYLCFLAIYKLISNRR